LSTSVLVTGCAGFIGINLCMKLVKHNYSVIGIDNFLNKNSKLNIHIITELSKNSNFKFFNVDILDRDSMESIFRKYEVRGIFHLASLVGVRESLNMPTKYLSYNTEGISIILEMCRKYDIKTFIFSSSSSVYGNCKGLMKEKMKTKPISPYAVSKRACEILGETYSYLYDIRFTALRLFSVYGPFQRPDLVINRFLNAVRKNETLTIFGDGSSKRDFSYIDDIVSGMIQAFEKKYEFQIINLGTGRPISLNYLLEKIQEHLHKKAIVTYCKRSKAEPYETFADITKAKKLLNYNPKTRFEEGLKNQIEWFNSQKI